MKKIVLGLGICGLLILAFLVVFFVTDKANKINQTPRVDDPYELNIIYNECQLINDDLKMICKTPADDERFAEVSKAKTMAMKQQTLKADIADYNRDAPKVGKPLLKEEDFPDLTCIEVDLK